MRTFHSAFCILNSALQNVSHLLLRIAEAQHSVEPFIFQQGDKAAFFQEGAQTGVAEEVEQTGGLRNAAARELRVVEIGEGGFIQRASKGHQTGQVGLGRVIDGVETEHPASDFGLADSGGDAGEPGGGGHLHGRVGDALHLGAGQFVIVADAADVAATTYNNFFIRNNL